MIGETLLQYRITGRLGAGGMGVVWKAVDTRLSREVALKLLPENRTGDLEPQQRFLREARAASALNHPNVVTIYEINSDRGITFIAMEYVKGKSLRAVIQDGRLAPDVAMNCATQIAEGISKAHSLGIIHRDLKPGNIMVNEDGVIKILDFGLARIQLQAQAATADSDVTQTALTLPGAALGTPAYMSPEQVVGEVADQRSDIFSFGVILYELFSSKSPFERATASETVRAVLTSEPEPLRTIATGLPPALYPIVGRCLQKNPAHRYQNATDLLIDLRGSHTQQAVSVAAIPASERPRTRRSLIIGGAALVCVAAVGLAIFGLPDLTLAFPVRARTDAASTSIGNRSPHQATSDARDLLNRYYRPNAIDQAIALLDSTVKAYPNHAAAYAALSEAYIRRNLINRDAKWVKLAEDSARKAIEIAPDVASSLVALGNVHFEKGARAEALSVCRKAADLDPRSTSAALCIAKVLAMDGKDADADLAFQNAIRLGPDNWIPHTEFGLYRYRQSRFSDAVQLFQHAATFVPDNAIVLRNLSGAFMALDRFDEAASVLQRALEIQPSGNLYSNLGYVRFAQGRYSEAIAPFEKAVSMSSNRYLFWGNLADIYRWTPGNDEKAHTAYGRAIQLARENLATAADDPELRGSLAVYLARSGDKRAAKNELAAFELLKRKTPGSLFKCVLAYEIIGDRQKALASAAAAIKAGHPVRDFKQDPDLLALRADPRYHRLTAAETARIK